MCELQVLEAAAGVHRLAVALSALQDSGGWHECLHRLAEEGMSGVPFAWMWGDPAESVDRLREMRARMEKAEMDLRERELRHKRRRVRKLVRLAKARALKGQK